MLMQDGVKDNKRRRRDGGGGDGGGGVSKTIRDPPKSCRAGAAARWRMVSGMQIERSVETKQQQHSSSIISHSLA